MSGEGGVQFVSGEELQLASDEEPEDHSKCFILITRICMGELMGYKTMHFPENVQLPALKMEPPKLSGGKR